MDLKDVSEYELNCELNRRKMLKANPGMYDKMSRLDFAYRSGRLVSVTYEWVDNEDDDRLEQYIIISKREE